MITLRYLPEFDNYGIEKSKINKDDKTPQIRISEKDFAELSHGIKPKAKIGFLLGQDKSADGKEFYTIDKDYLTSMIKAGAEPVFLDYDNAVAQLSECDGLILPGGAFNSPKNFYIKSEANEMSKRAQAYIFSAIAAEQANKPILGICAGAQMVGGLHGRKMYASLSKETSSPIAHKTKSMEAHNVIIKEGCPLAEIMQTSGIVNVNSRHNEAMIEDIIQTAFYKTDMELYAVSQEDNIPEAWGNKEKNILCIQWHPENLAAQNNQSMQNIYNWIVNKSAEVRISKNKKNMLPLFINRNKNRL